MRAMKREFRWAQLLKDTSRWGAVALAAFYLNFISVHLATEMHFHGEGHSQAAGADQDHDHDHDDGAHTPHDASEHWLDVVAKGADVFHAPVLLIAAENFVLRAPVIFTWTQRIFERERPPGESPPDPLQPRGPPIA